MGKYVLFFILLHLLSTTNQAQNNLPDTIKQEDLKEVVVAGIYYRDFSIHEKSLTPYAPKDQNLFVTYNSQVSKDWSLTLRGSYIQNDSKGDYMWVTGVNNSNPNILLRNPKYDLPRYIVYSQQAFVNGRFRTGTVQHNFLGGFDANQKRFHGDLYVEYNKTSTNALVYCPQEVNNPVYGAQEPNYSAPGGVKAGNTFQKAEYLSFCALEELLFLHHRLRLTPGARATSLQTKNVLSGAPTSSSDFPITPRIGLNYSVNPRFSVYALFDNTLQPQTGVKGVAVVSNGTTTYNAGNAIEPLQGRIFEVGLKKDWAGDKRDSTISFYSIDRKHIAQVLPSPIYREEIGTSRSRGMDIDIKGEIVKSLSVVIDYAYNDSMVTHDVNPALVQARTPMFVMTIQNTWLNYTLPTRLKDFGLSLGYQYMGGRGERYTTATPYKIPDYSGSKAAPAGTISKSASTSWSPTLPTASWLLHPGTATACTTGFPTPPVCPAVHDVQLVI